MPDFFTASEERPTPFPSTRFAQDDRPGHYTPAAPQSRRAPARDDTSRDRRRSRRGIACLLLLASLTLHCATRRAVVPFAPIAASTRDAAWNELLRLQGEIPGARSLVSVRITSGSKRQSFKADLAVDREHRLRLDGFTPLGTAAFTVYAEEESILFVDHTANTFWRGTVGEFADRVALFPRDILPRDLAMIVLGLPAQIGFDYDVTERGLASVAWPSGTAEYDPAAFPPQRVLLTLASGSQTVEIRHLDLSVSDERVQEPRINRSYREAAPRISL
ncbi:MAG TPA: hypothetical protein VIL97_10675 [Thermoanaerobaculia bacterium]